ncbi:MAG: ABC transporter ATP-binding protein [Anaerolineaceae bacterium]|nr:ABC transporter ATP-binding protein [Anaerolineaceae bacterium]
MLEVREIVKAYESQPLLRGISFSVSMGETVCLLGASGSGKSTLLRIIAGLEQPDDGQVLWQGEDLAAIPVHRRQFGLVFQDYALFPHRSVAENISFGLRMQGLAREVIQERVAAALEQVNMKSFAARRVTDLSGGEQQRVALARALAPRPKLLMFDEPLGALDKALRTQLLDELRKLLQNSEIPAIYVTHDQEEAFAIADRLVLLHEGCVEQEGPPPEVYARPTSPWAARFLGFINLLPGKVVSSNPLRVETALGCWWAGNSTMCHIPAEKPVTLLLKPYGALPVTDRSGHNLLEGVVQSVLFRGEGFRVDVLVQGQEFQFVLNQYFAVGQTLVLKVAPEAVLCLGEGN